MSINVEVTLEEAKGDSNKLIKKFIKKVKKEGIIEKYKNYSAYTKPSFLRRQKKLNKLKLSKQKCKICSFTGHSSKQCPNIR